MECKNVPKNKCFTSTNLDLDAEYDKKRRQHVYFYKYGPIDLSESLRLKTGTTKLRISGSLHKFTNFLNSGLSHNANNVSFAEMLISLNEIESRYFFGNHFYPTQLEFGVNFENVSFEIMKFLKDKLVVFDYKIRPCFVAHENMVVFRRINYEVKIYFKSKQLSIPQSILRIEVKYKNQKAIRTLGINSFDDLKSPEISRKAISDLIKKFNKILIVDHWELPEKATIWEKERFAIYTNLARLDEHRKLRGTTTLFNDRKKLKSTLEKYGLDKTKSELLAYLKDYSTQFFK